MREIAPEPLDELIDRISTEVGVPATSLRNLVDSESDGDTKVVSPTGDRGIAQINNKHHSEVSDKCAFDPECALRWTAKRIKDGYGYEWVSGNCYAFVKVVLRQKTGKELPKMADIRPTLLDPFVGSIVVFQYKDRTVKHLAYVEKIEGDKITIREANYEPFKIGRRVVSVYDKAIIGYYML